MPSRLTHFCLLLALAALTGCGASSTSEVASPRALPSEAEPQNSPNTSARSTTAPSSQPDGPRVPLPRELAEMTADRPTTPVVAPRPAPQSDAQSVTNTPSASTPNVELASAERPTAQVLETVQITDPNADPSRYPGGIVPASPDAQPLPGGPRLLVPERQFKLEGRPPALRVYYDDLDLLRVLNMGEPLPEDVVEQFPDWLRALDGKTIRLRGFMYPAYEEMLSAFILTRDTGACCFGPNPRVYYLVSVKLKEGTKVRYIENRPFDVRGTFKIAPRYVDGTWYQLYRIEDAVVE